MSSPTTKVLLLEDDPNLGFVLQEHLETLGYAVHLRTNGFDGLSASHASPFDLYLVDVMMPKKDGFTFAREVRVRGDQTPIIFLTARSLKEDRIEGFRAGGDDYVTKPFSMEELTLRITAVLKRTKGTTKKASLRGIVPLGSFMFDTGSQTLTRGTKTKKLTSKESQVLSLLAHHANEVVERKSILKEVWGEDSIYTSRSLDVFVSKLRKYVSADATIEIMNAHGVGYRLAVREGPIKNEPTRGMKRAVRKKG